MSIARKARKQHTCILCDLHIEPGETHIYRRITPWDHPDNDNFYTYRAHLQCDEFWADVGVDYDWVRPHPFSFREDLQDAQISK